MEVAELKVAMDEKVQLGERVLFVSPTDMLTDNGMARRQQQILSALCSHYPGAVDVLSLGAGQLRSRKWLQHKRLGARVLRGWFARVAGWNARLWYAGGVLLCNKLRWATHFGFPIRTRIPQSWIDRYKLIVCFYPWAYRLTALERAGAKVIVDTGDVMANRHQRCGARRWISLASHDESLVLASGGRCIAISQDDADEFQRLYGVSTPVVPFVPPDFAELNAIASASDRPVRVGFMGAPSFVNEEILRTLASDEFLARLAAHGIELVIAGGICSTAAPSILASLKKGGARIMGSVSSSPDYYRQISATVNPVGPSTGVKIKSVETLIAGRALITTRWGADSLLTEAFPGQISYIDWPVAGRALAERCAVVVRNATNAEAQSGINYVRRAKRALIEVLST